MLVIGVFFRLRLTFSSLRMFSCTGGTTVVFAFSTRGALSGSLQESNSACSSPLPGNTARAFWYSSTAPARSPCLRLARAR